ncbi:rhomboid family intramembrane serine protease [Pseudoneobacillus sp. C159]
MLEDYRFWSLANHLVKEENYRILHLTKEQNELWLENPDSKQMPVVRLLNCTLDWSNWMERDIQLTAMNGENIRKQRFQKSLHILNIYISPYPPVDDYENRLKQLGSFDQISISTYILSRDAFQDVLSELERIFKKNLSVTQPSDDEITDERVASLKRHTIELANKRVEAERNIFSYGKPILTYVFMAIQVIVFLLLELNGGSQNSRTLVEFGAKFNPLILEGEWWRFITPIFLHIGFLHLFMNTLSLYFLGTAVEKIYGTTRFFWIYLFSGILGVIASFAFSPNLSAGASGAIYGCFGALLYIGMVYPGLFFRTLGRNLITILILNIVISFTVPSIDMAGHLGGLVGGFVATGMVHFPKKKKIANQLLFFLFTLLITGSLLYFGFQNAQANQEEGAVLQIAQQYVQDNDYDKSYHLLSKFLKENDEPSEYLLFQLSYVEIQLGKVEEARVHLEKAIEINPNFHEAQFNLAILLIQKNEINDALEHAEKAVELAPNNQKYKEILETITK